MISIILVEPENSENVGAVARAMKNMGLRDLRLVKPPPEYVKDGKKMAMSALDVLLAARIFSGLEQAVADAQLVVGTSRRHGPKRGKFLEFDAALKKIGLVSERGQVALVFGKESKGLDNECLDLCDWVVSIPSHEDYPSLNLAQAVMVMAFALFRKKGRVSAPAGRPEWFATKAEILEVLGRMRGALEALGYQNEGLSVIDRILRTLHMLFKRNGLQKSEAQMFRGLARKITERQARK